MTARALLAAALLSVLAVVPAAAQQHSPTAHCYDGTYYYGTSRREACAHHHGVSEWLGSVSRAQLRTTARRPAHPHKPAKRAPAPAGATARCHDGSWSTSSHRATACAHHGGVARWLGRH